MQTYGPQGVTVTPIYWDPSRAKKHLSSSYERVINGFITNVAAASAASTNVFSIDSEYYDILGRQPSDIRYHMTAGTPIVDTRPLPGDRCYKTARGYDTCVTDDQLMAELSYVIAAHHLPRGLAYFYPVFLPPGVETQDGRGYTSASSYCAYHGSTGTGATQIVYGDEPYPPDGCYSGQSPNGDAAADSQIDTLSHEMNEAVTDPQFVGRGGWQDHAGFEVGDLCDWTFGPPLGFTDRRAPEATEYNQVINGGRYYVQLEFSNYAYQRFGVGDGCQASERDARGTSRPNNSPTHIYFDMSRTRLPANGRAKSLGLVQVWGKHHFDTPGDRIYFTTYSLYGGAGRCGKLHPRAAITDGAGTVEPTYQASDANIACVIVATDAEGGRSASVAVYQGSTRNRAPRARASFPTLVEAGRTLTFMTSFHNPAPHRLADAQVQFGIFVPFYNSPNVTHRQVHLSVSWHGRGGPFLPVRLTGSTSKTAGIIGVIGGKLGFNLRPRSTVRLTYRMTVSKSVPLRRSRPILEFQTFLDQLNPASGAESVLGATRAIDARVR